MSRKYNVLPCNGLDKCAGCIAGELAKMLVEMTESKIICPVFYRTVDSVYKKQLEESPLLVLDGCSVRCASKLASERALKIAEKMNISEEAKTRGIEISKGLTLGEADKQLAKLLFEVLTKEQEIIDLQDSSVPYPDTLSYEIYKKDKFIFRVPKDPGFYFNENDIWAYVSGNKARIGVTDFVQKSLSDIMFFSPPAIGSEIEQFEEVGSIESGKAVFEIVSPVSGTITAINEEIVDAPEKINGNPYEEGWIAELELSDFEEDKELLHEFDGYFPVLKRKVDEFHV